MNPKPPSSLTPPVAAELRRLRVEVLDLGQREMAEALHLTLRTYQRYEAGTVVKVPASVVDEARSLAAVEEYAG